MTYQPAFAPLGKLTYLGAGNKRQFVRPAGVPYPSDPTFRYCVDRVDSFSTRYRTDREIQKRKHQRRQFLDKISVDGDGCWIWLGTVDRSARCRPVFRGSWQGQPGTRVVGAFRWLVAEWFPDQLGHLDRWHGHTVAKCQKRACVRPQCRSAGYDQRLFPTRPPTRHLHLSRDTVAYIKRELATKRSVRALAAEVGCTRHAIYDIRKGKFHRDVPAAPPELQPSTVIDRVQTVTGRLRGPEAPPIQGLRPSSAPGRSERAK